MNDSAARRGTASAYSTYVLAVMGLVYFISFVDRSILGILLVPISKDFHLTDSEIGFLIGPAFGLVFAVLALPLSSMGDRFSRRNVIVGSAMVFGAATLLSGYTTAFWQLLIARLGFGAGLAGVQPSVNSILSDVLPREKRSTAMAIGTTCGRCGGIAAAVFGGWLAAHYGWRVAMIVVGIPGLLLALLVLFTIREPSRGHIDNRKDKGVAPPLSQVLKYLLACATYRDILIGSIFVLLTTTTMSTFTPMIFMRGHHVSLTDASLIAGGFAAISAVVTWGVGILTDRLCRRSLRWMMYLPALLQVLIIPFFPIFLLSGNLTLAIVAGAITAMFGGPALTGPLYAAIQNVAPLRVRSMAMGVYSFVAGIVGAAFGPQVIGWVSEYLKPIVGTQSSLAWSILILTLPSLTIGAWFFWRGARTLEADMANAEAS